MSATGETETEEEESPEDPESRRTKGRAPQLDRKSRKEKKREEEVINFSHGSQNSQIDLLDYRWMAIVSSRWAATGRVLQSILSLIVISFFCIGSLMLLRVLYYGWEGIEVLFP